MTDAVISIARDFSPVPAGRHPADGPFNGERFRESILAPAIDKAIQQHGRVIVDFADADSYSSSFLEEVFGGLARSRRFPPQVIRSVLYLKSDDPVYNIYVSDARDYLERELQKIVA